MSVLVGVLSNQEKDNFQPVGVQEFLFELLVKADDPPSTILVPWIFPVREDSLLEDGVVSTRRKLARDLYVVVEGPEVLNSCYCDDGPLVLFPSSGFVVLEEPQGPSVLKGVFDVSSWSSYVVAFLISIYNLSLLQLVHQVSQLVSARRSGSEIPGVDAGQR